MTRRRRKGDGRSIDQTQLYYKVLLLTRMRRKGLRLYITTNHTDWRWRAVTPVGWAWGGG